MDLIDEILGGRAITLDDVAQESDEHGPWRTQIKLTDEIVVGPDSPRTILRTEHLYKTVCAFFGRPPRTMLDLGALNGALYVPFAAAGTQVMAVDARMENCRKMRILNACRGWQRCTVLESDVRNLEIPRDCEFINLSGLFYHLEHADALGLLAAIAEAMPPLLVLDSWFSDSPTETVEFTYAGKTHKLRGQHNVAKSLTNPDSAFGNPTSFRFKCEDVVAFLYDLGFAAVVNHLFIWERIPGFSRHKSGSDHKFRKMLLAYGTR